MRTNEALEAAGHTFGLMPSAPRRVSNGNARTIGIPIEPDDATTPRLPHPAALRIIGLSPHGRRPSECPKERWMAPVEFESVVERSDRTVMIRSASAMIEGADLISGAWAFDRADRMHSS